MEPYVGFITAAPDPGRLELGYSSSPEVYNKNIGDYYSLELRSSTALGLKAKWFPFSFLYFGGRFHSTLNHRTNYCSVGRTNDGCVEAKLTSKTYIPAIEAGIKYSNFTLFGSYHPSTKTETEDYTDTGLGITYTDTVSEGNLTSFGLGVEFSSFNLSFEYIISKTTRVTRKENGTPTIRNYPDSENCPGAPVGSCTMTYGVPYTNLILFTLGFPFIFGGEGIQEKAVKGGWCDFCPF